MMMTDEKVNGRGQMKRSMEDNDDRRSVQWKIMMKDEAFNEVRDHHHYKY